MKTKSRTFVYRNLLLLAIIVLALMFRFYNFSERVTYGPEQAISLITSGKIIKSKFTLLGQENVQRITSKGHIIFSGALFTYSLIPLQTIFSFAPIPITAYFAVLNLLTGVVLFIVVRKLFNFRLALLSTTLFLFNNYMLYHSMFIWILNYLPLIGILSFYFLVGFKNDKRLLNVFLLGLLCGVGFGLEYLYLLTAVIVYLYLAYYSREKIKMSLVFISGAVLGNLPMLIFDLRHDFYHLRSLWQYFVDTLMNPEQSFIAYYHFLHFWPIFALLGGLLLLYMWKRNKFAAVFSMIIYIVFNLSSSLVSFDSSAGMPKGLTTLEVIKASESISQDKPEEFNVVSLLDFDARGHILRYPLEYIYGVIPMGVEEYKEAQSLYVISEKSYDFDKAGVWEINVFEPKEVEILSEIDEDYAVYKLTK